MFRNLKVAVMILMVAGILSLAATAALAQAQVCQPPDAPTPEEVVSGVTLSWNGAFHCLNAPEEGEYEFTVEVSNDGASASAVTIEAINLTDTTPKPRGATPEATVAEVVGLPLTIEPGQSGSFTVRGTYKLVQAGAARLANLHFMANGQADSVPFNMGINAAIRTSSDIDEPEDERGGPPSWVPAPPDRE